jgi:hypothetical protein
MTAARSYNLDFNGNTGEQTFAHIAEAFGIDGMNHPVLLLDGNVRVLAANAEAFKLLSRKQPETNGCLLGDVIGCAHARKSDFCEKMFNCTSCAIKQAVTYTLVTEEDCREVPVYPDTGLTGQDKKTPFLISTKKVFDYVFLTVQSKT